MTTLVIQVETQVETESMQGKVQEPIFILKYRKMEDLSTQFHGWRKTMVVVKEALIQRQKQLRLGDQK